MNSRIYRYARPLIFPHISMRIWTKRENEREPASGGDRREKQRWQEERFSLFFSFSVFWPVRSRVSRTLSRIREESSLIPSKGEEVGVQKKMLKQGYFLYTRCASVPRIQDKNIKRELYWRTMNLLRKKFWFPDVPSLVCILFLR